MPVFLLRDSISYFLPAWDLLNGYGFDLSIRRTPVYPGFLAGAMALFGEDLLAVAFAQHLLGVASAVLVYVLGRMTVGRVAGLIAALVTALNGALIIAEHYLMPEVALIFLLLLTFVVFLGAAAERTAAGVPGVPALLLGLTLLCKPVAQILIPVLPLVLVVSYASLRRAIVPSLLIGAGLLAVMVPWMAPQRRWSMAAPRRPGRSGRRCWRGPPSTTPASAGTTRSRPTPTSAARGSPASSCRTASASGSRTA